MRGSSLAVLAGRNFLRHRDRYRLLLGAIILVTAILVVIIGTVLGMNRALRSKASRYFAGDVAVLGLDGTGESLIEDSEIVRDILEQVNRLPRMGVSGRSERSTYYDSTGATIFFSGYSIPQRRVVGVDWELEREVLSTFHFVQGGVPPPGDRAGILVSTAVAGMLHVRTGDEVILSVRARRGRTDTATLVVRGIYGEASFFGYTAYVERRTLNRLKGVPEDRINEMGVYLARGDRDEERVALEITERLAAAGVPVFPVIRERDHYSGAAWSSRSERQYGTVTLSAQLQEVQDLLQAVAIIGGIVIVLFLGMVAVGVNNTWSMIVRERTTEIGTVRALGMQRERVVRLFLVESLYLGITGGIVGIMTGVAILEAVRHGWYAGSAGWAALFLVQGRLSWHVTPGAIAGVLALVVVSAVAGCTRAAARSGRIPPAEAMRN